MLLGINVFPVIGGIYYWFPKMTGRLMDERLGRWNFWVMFIGFNLAFFPMHVIGLLGMPRRVYTYPSGYGWDTLNLASSIGAFLFAIGVLLFLINVLRSLRQGEKAGPNPWDASTLEWSTPSPPQPYNFAVIPTLASRHPLWEDRLGEEDAGRSILDRGPLLDHGRETLGTTALDGEPDVILKMPEDSCAPIVMALLLTALCYCALIHSWWLCVVSVLGIFVCLVIWLWPQVNLAQTVKNLNHESAP
ncbi:cytochrome c oxidase subunit 1 [mine drainage metagenome]|uniref:Cytochrome c oxidase subunit 1 n=1 Tax=mine drainage metagenome TaxID=410659 RepID=A0A1J5PVI4_9ZZZZ